MVTSFEDITSSMVDSLRYLKDGSRFEVPPHHKERLVEEGYIKDVGTHHLITMVGIERMARGK
jgi:hypothetical protein